MSCGALESGDRFLVSAISYLECSGGTLGIAGYQSLADAPFITNLLLALLTLFVALLGLRLMFGRPFDFGDAALAAARVGFVLMLGLSWPAVQTLVYETVTRGPAQVVERLSGASGSIAVRMQSIDNGVVALTAWGTGRLDIRAGQTASGMPAASSFAGEATNESLALSLGRIMLVTSVLVSMGAILLGSGLLIAVLPLFAGFLLFNQSRSLFFGWAKSMAFLFFVGIAVPAVLMMQANVMEPWLQRVIAEREQMLATPGAPMELLALTGSFAVLLLFTVWLLSRVCFNNELTVTLWQTIVQRSQPQTASTRMVSQTSSTQERFSEISRATHLASVLDIAARRESVSSSRLLQITSRQTSQSPLDIAVAPSNAGTAGRRTQPREAGSLTRRDMK